MNTEGNRFDARPQAPRVAATRPPAQGQQASIGQSRPSAGGNRGFRGRPQYPRYGSSSHEAGSSRHAPRNTETEPNPVDEAALEKLENFHTEEQTIRNDLALRYATSGEWGGNHIKGVEPEERCIEYPKLRHLMELKQEQVTKHAHPALHLPFDAVNDSLMSLTTHLPVPFDVILIDPPPSYDWTKITSIPIRLISADPSFVFLWVGDAAGEGLEKGREALLKWGFRRCEEILWVKPNRKAIQAKERTTGDGHSGETDVQRWMREGRKDAGDRPKNIMITQKEHCLMGIRGTVRRKTDNWFVHCNVDTDVMVWEREDDDETSPRFPPQLYDIIENFCLGTRRLELFGPRSKARKGWVTVGEDDMVGRPDEARRGDVQDYTTERYTGFLQNVTDHLGRNVLPPAEDIEAIRPKSPIRGDRHGSTASAAPPPQRPRPGGPPNRPEMGGFDRRQGAFRPPPRHQFPPRPMFPDPPSNPHWMNAPPRMQVPYQEAGSAYPASAWGQMRGALDAIDPGYLDDAGRLQHGVPTGPMYGVSGAFPSPELQQYQPYPPPQSHVMPRFQQYRPSIDNTIPQPIERTFPPQFPHQQFPPPNYVQQQQYSYNTHPNGPSFGHQNGPSFMHVGNGQYYANDLANGQYYANDLGPAGAPGTYHIPGTRAPYSGNQHWGN